MIWVWALFFAAASCQRHSQWHCQQLNEKTEKTSRILYCSEDRSQGIDVVMIGSDEQFTVYLQVHSQPLVTSEVDCEKVAVRLGEKLFFASYHLGKQRVLLSEEMQNELFLHLQTGSPITIEMIGYRETVDPTHFSTKAPSVLNRIRLY